jgi:transcriptional regulator with XRE-family HTH domain
MEFDYSKLLGRIREYGYTQKTLANAIGMSVSQLNQCLKSRANFKHKMILAICRVLDIQIAEIGAFFYTLKTRKTEQ